jgi:signal transduction histidine kinase
MAESSGISLIAEYEPDLPPILGERRQLYRAGSNLVSNAIHYTPTGRVRVATTLDVAARRACLEIEDSGMGIAPQDMPHIFERFYRGDHRHIPGNGLGLSIVKEIVDVHSGTIEVQSRPGEGARFKICFPLSAAVNA